MNKQKLTKRLIDSLTYDGHDNSRFVVWDDKLSGFGIRVYPSGRKTYILMYRSDGRQRQLTIGDASALTLAQAREHAKRHIGSLVGGADPLEQRRTRQQGETFRDLSDKFINDYAKRRKKSWKKDQSRINRHLSGWMNRKLTSITNADVSTLHARIGVAAPYEANRLLALLKIMFNLSEQWGFTPADYRPCRGVEKFKEKKRERWITQEELPRLAQSIDQEQNIYIRAALWLYLLTGMRKNEVLSLKWDSIDQSQQLITLSSDATKAGRALYMPISAPVASIFEALPKIKGNSYVLPGVKQGQHLVNIDKAWGRVRARAGVADVRLHDLRRTVGSWLAQSGASLHLIGKVLNHANTSTTAIYAHFGQDQVRDAMDRLGQEMLTGAGKANLLEVGS